MKSKHLSSILFYLTPLLCLIGVFFLQNQNLNKVQSKDKVDFAQEEQSTRTILELQKQLPSFGFDNLIANRNFLDFIQYFGDEKARENTGYSLIPEYFEMMVNRDPHFVQAYLQLSTANSIYAGRPDKTVALMNQVLQSISPETSPLGLYIWIYKGVDEILYLGDLKAARHSYEMASKWASIQGNAYMANQTRETAQYLASNPDSRQTQIGAWTTILTTSTDEKTRQYAIDKIKSLGAEIVMTPQGTWQIRMSGTN